MWKRWSHAFRAAALTVFGMIAAALPIMALPFVSPIMAWAEKRAVGRKRRLGERSPCDWCMAPSGEPALARADDGYAVRVDMVVGPGLSTRVVRIAMPGADTSRHPTASSC